jgi:hypothetical protein
VDDDHLVRELIGDVLRRLGYQVREAHSGEQALAQLDDAPTCCSPTSPCPSSMARNWPWRPANISRNCRWCSSPATPSLDNMELPNSLLIQKPVHEHVLALALAELLENREQKRKNRPEAIARYC